MIGTPTELTVVNGTAYVDLPEIEGIASWRLDLRLYWRGLRIDWSSTADAMTTVELTVPDSGYTESTQEEWLSRVRVIAMALDDSGHEVARQELDRLWVVWDGGRGAAPRWFDTSARSAEAPFDAWSMAARALVASIEVREGEMVEVEPPPQGVL